MLPSVQVLVLLTCISGSSTQVPHDQIPATTNDIRLYDGGITSLGANEFSRYTQLNKLVVYSHPVSSVASTAFTGTVLRYFSLNNAPLTAMPIFTGLSTLQEVHIGNVPLTTISATAFQGTNLTVLELQFTKLTAMPDLSGLSNFARLVINSCVTITTCPDTAFSGTAISYLRLVRLGLTRVPNLSDIGSTLKTFIIESCPLTTSDFSTFGHALSLEYLSLHFTVNNNAYTEFPDFPMAMRSSPTFKTFKFESRLLNHISAGRLVGFQLDTLSITCSVLFNFPSYVPCEIFNISRTLTLNMRWYPVDPPYKHLQHYSAYRKCLCERDDLRLEVLDLMAEGSSFYDVMTNVFCNTVAKKQLTIKTAEAMTPCDCRNVWLAFVYTECNVIHKSGLAKGPCHQPVTEWGSLNDTLNCPQDFVLLFAKPWFKSPFPIITGAQTLDTTIETNFSAIIRGKYAWRMKSSDGDVHLRPGPHPQVGMSVEPTSIEPLFKSDVRLPPNADPVPNTTPCAPKPLAYPDLLGDRDIDSCYKITNQSSQEFTLWNRQSSAQTFVYLMTKELDCRIPFFMQVFVERGATKQCNSGRNPVECALTKSKLHSTQVTSCQFTCNCALEECRMDNKIILFLSDIDVGYLCEVFIRTANIDMYNDGWY